MERLEMKQRAVQYYNENQVPKQLEILLNTMFTEEPTDIYGYMVRKYSKMNHEASMLSRSEITYFVAIVSRNKLDSEVRKTLWGRPV